MTRAEAQARAARSVAVAKANRIPNAKTFALNAVKDGMTFRAAADYFGIGTRTLKTAAHEAGVRIGEAERIARIIRTVGVVWTPEMLSALVEMRAAGKSVAECARRIGVDEVTCRKKAHELGIGGRLA